MQMINESQLIEKWESKDVGKLSIKNIGDYNIKRNMAKLLENQDNLGRLDGSQLLREAAFGSINTGTAGGYTDGAGDSGSYIFKPISLALMRRTFPDLFANKIVGTQAMSTPYGLAYALRVMYNDGSNNEAAWEAVQQYAGYTGSSVGTSAALRGGVNTSANTGFGDTSATGAATSAAEGWTLSGGVWPLTSTSGTITPPTGFGAWPQLKIHIDQKSIYAQERKLAASYSLEAAQDIQAMQGLSIEKEMITFLQYEIIAEMDREIITAVKNAAVDTTNGGAVINAIDLTGNGTGIDGRWSGEKYMNIIASIVYQANMIAKKTRRGAGNFAVVSSGIASALQGAGHPFVTLNANVNPTQVMTSIGKVNSYIDVYHDMYCTSEMALVGFKGPRIDDAGVIFSPYIMGLTDRAVDPLTHAPNIGVLSRYALTTNLLGAGRYYRLIPFFNMSNLIAGANATDLAFTAQSSI